MAQMKSRPLPRLQALSPTQSSMATQAGQQLHSGGGSMKPGWVFPDPVKVHSLAEGMSEQVTKSVGVNPEQNAQRLLNRVDHLPSESSMLGYGGGRGPGIGWTPHPCFPLLSALSSSINAYWTSSLCEAPARHSARHREPASGGSEGPDHIAAQDRTEK